MLGKEGLGEVCQVGDHPVVSVCPEGGKFKAVAGLLASGLPSASLLDVADTGGIGVIFGVGAVGNDEDLDILIQAAPRPEAVPLIPLDLVKGLGQRHAPPLELYVYERETVDQDRHIIAGVVLPLALLVLVEHLEAVVVDVSLVQQVDIFGGSAVLPQHLHVVALDLAGFLHDPLVGTRDAVLEKTLPFRVGKAVVVQQFQLAAQIGDQGGLIRDGEIFIPLGLKIADELPLQGRLALVCLCAVGLRGVLRHYGALIAGGDNVILAHKISRSFFSFQLSIVDFIPESSIYNAVTSSV